MKIEHKRSSNPWLYLYLLIVAAFIGFNTDYAHAAGITTGQAGGTYYAFGQNLQQMCPKQIDGVYESAGSLTNMERVLSDKRTQYGIVQMDVRDYMVKIQGNKEVENKIKMIFPLYAEEIHVMVPFNSLAKNLSDLAGKRVVVGADGSGNYVTAQIMKSKADIDWTDVLIDPKSGMTQLILGQVDAVIAVGGKPLPYLAALGSAAKGKIRLISINNPALDSYYIKTSIPDGLYDWSPQRVSTYAVKSILVTFDFKTQYQNDIQQLVACISTNLDTLQGDSRYHAKWREVDPSSYTQVQWPVSPVALKYLTKKK